MEPGDTIETMTDEGAGQRRGRKRLAAALAVLTVLLAIVIIPPLVSVGRYKGRIAQAISASLGRPVRLSSVELRLLPRPGFVLTDLTVEEDPAYGAEPVLYASSVTASIRLFSLLRGLQISSISADDAHLNLVRSSSGHWNVESLLRTASQPVAAGATGHRRMPFPYIEATESRINIKNGAEKLPFSLVNADLAFWQENPGEWRIRLKGQPARTDLNLDLADTGIVRMEADVHRAAELRQLPLHLDLEWQEAQLGQLARLLAGADPGWRGDMTGELHIDGMPDSAQVKARLRASNVHRAEFAPAAPMDFDANCGFVYHYAAQSAENVECDSPIGEGRMRLTGVLPGVSSDSPSGSRAGPHFAVELDRFPIAFALDALRTVRSGLPADLEATGTMSGRMTYSEPHVNRPMAQRLTARSRLARPRSQPQGPLAGSFAVQGFELTGDGLTQPIRLTKGVIEAAAPPGPTQTTQGIAVSANYAAEAPTPLAVSANLGFSGYQLSIRGQGSLDRLRDLAHLCGIDRQANLSTLTAGPATIDLAAHGPWLAEQPLLVEAGSPPAPEPAPDQISGTIALRDAHWRTAFLANPVAISQATLHIDGSDLRWDPAQFSYGPVSGTATLDLPQVCAKPEGCPPQFQIQFGALDAGELEAAILGAQEPGTLLSELIAKLSLSHSAAWPRLEGTVKADSLSLGQHLLIQPTAILHIAEDRAEISNLDAGLLAGQVHASGTILSGSSDGNKSGKPSYSLSGDFHGISPSEVGQLLGERWSGGPIDGNGKLELSGFTASELAASAHGTLHFDWGQGSMGMAVRPADNGGDPPTAIPPPLARFDHWTADAEIAAGAVTLKENEIRRSGRMSSVSASVSFGDPPRLVFSPAKRAEISRR